MLYDVFLSYTSSDRELAVRILGALERAGLSVWWDAKLTEGTPFDLQIKDALVESVALVALISRDALKSKWVRWEIAQAPAGGMRVVPVLADDVAASELPRAVAAFSPLRWLEPVDALAAEIAACLGPHGSARLSSDDPRDESQIEVLRRLSLAASESVRHRRGQPRIPRQPIAHASSAGLPSFLAQHQLAVGFTSSASDSLYLVQPDRSGRIALSGASFPRPMGLCVLRDELHITTHSHIHTLVRVAGKRSGEECYLPRVARFTGALDIHDVRLRANGEAIFVNTRFNCLATLSTRANFRPIWEPFFLNGLIDGDCCHLNGLATNDDGPTYCTAVSLSSHAEGWREEPIGKGVVIEVEHARVACEGLTFPHTPRHHDGKLWLLNSGEGEFGFLDVDGRSTNGFTTVSAVPGFARGLAFHGRFALVGISKPRYGLSDGLPIHRRMQQSGEPPWCGFQVIDTRSGECVEWFRFEGPSPSEISALEVIPNVFAVAAYGSDSEVASEFISWEN